MVLVVSRHLFQCIQLTTCMCCINAITINCELQVNSKLALGNPRKVNLFVFTEFGTLYQKLSDAVLKYGYSIRDVPKDGNCGLHAVVDQLRMQGITGWCVANLRQKAVDDINSRGLPDGFLDKAEYKDAADYMKRQRNSGTWCDEPLLRSICEVVGKAISIIHDNGLQSILQPQSDPSNNDDAPLVVGLMTDSHYVSLQPLSAASQTNTIVHQVESRQDIEQPETTEVANTEQVMSAARVEFSDSNDTIQLPHCVSLLSWKAWTKSREWLFAENRKVYCKVCCEIHKTGFSSMKAVVGAKVKLNFVHGVTTDHLKKEHQAQRKKLLKKIDKHAGSQTHLVCVQIKQQASKGKLKEAVQKAQTVWDEANAEKLEATCKVFRAAYMCAKEEMAFAKHPAVIELNELNGCTKTSMLHSHHSCANILKHIAKEMRTELNNYIKTTVHPFSIMLDETTTVSTKSVLIVFIRIQVGDEVCNFLYDLVELSDGSTGAEIAKAVLGCFAELGDEILQARLIGVSSDGASVMTGRHDGALVHMRKSLQADFVSFHCLAHRLELAVHAAVRSSGEVQRLQLFTDALYTFYHRSYKNTYELYGVADGIHAELMRITQVFTVRWVFSSFRAVKAFISDYGSLCNHMTNCAEDSTRNSKDRAKCSGFAKKLRDWNFVAELLLLADVLEVLWTLSAYMQSRNASLLDAHPKIAVAMKTLKMLKQQPGVNLSLLITSEKCVSTFQDITLTTHDKDFEVWYCFSENRLFKCMFYDMFFKLLFLYVSVTFSQIQMWQFS